MRPESNKHRAFFSIIENRISSATTTADPLLRPSTDSFRRMVRDISSMGFAADRVARIAEKLGADDNKKVNADLLHFIYIFNEYFFDDAQIVEHLIPLNELLDLGFDESQISDALIMFNNNKDKALDHLIS